MITTGAPLVSRWQGKKVIVIGAARQGTALARYLAARGATVILTDSRPAASVESALDSLADLPMDWALGGHPLELLDDADLVCPSGGVPLTIPFLQEATRRGIPLSNDTQIFMEEVPARLIGVTGSAGKTTTTTLVGRMAKAAVKLDGFPWSGHTAWVGGNIGNPLITELDAIQPADLVVIELSSFQLELAQRSPHIAAVLNITPNHLDRHGTMEAYTAAKARILAFQNEQDIAILGRDDPGSSGLAGVVKGRLVTFGLSSVPAGGSGSYLQEGQVMFATDGRAQLLLPVGDVHLRGEHNRLNVLAACAIASAAGFPTEAIRAGVQGFQGVAHRLELVREWRGARWYNDSIATAPERAMAAIRSFSEPLILLAGGRDKNLPWEDFARLAAERVAHLVLFGEAAALIEAAFTKQQRHSLTIDRCLGLHEAVQVAAQYVKPGYVVLLSPGGTSYDEFIDFEERGERYRQWVHQLS